MDWTAGYVADIAYTYGYYTELNPLHMRLAFLNAGIEMPEVVTACELGYGQGISVNVHAAGSNVRWYGTDFNPAQASFAQELAARCGAGAALYEDSFEEFLARPDLPDFDYIALHGIWSWISEENRAFIVEFLRRKLKPGGVVYISYNTYPGWAAFAPLRHLLKRHADTMSPDGAPITARNAEAFTFANKMMALNPSFARVNPLMASRLQDTAAKDAHYLAHEYFNNYWQPVHFSEMARWMTQAKLNFACSANHLEAVEALHLTAEQQAFMRDVPDAVLRQEVRDFMVNQAFRKDYWVKGAQTMRPPRRNALFRALRVMLVTPRDKVPLKVNGSLGEANMAPELYNPLLDVLADQRPRTVAELETALAGHNVTLATLLQALTVLAGTGHVSAVQDDETIAARRPYTDRYNAAVYEKSALGMEVQFLASPVTGGGFIINRIHHLFLMALAQGLAEPVQWARFAGDLLLGQGERMVVDKRKLETDEENFAYLTEQAESFATVTLPVLRVLQIA